MAPDYRQIFRFLRIVLLIVFSFLIVRDLYPIQVLASPYFYVTGTSSGVFKRSDTWSVILNTDGQRLTAVQTVVNFDESLFSQVMLSNLDSKCSFWAPADPSLGYGNGTTPYFLDGNKVVISCGFSNPGYLSTTSEGDPVLAFTLNPYFLGSTSFSLSDSEFRYIGSTIAPGTDIGLDYSVMSTEEAALLATPSPTPIPTPTPPLPTPFTLKSSDLTLQRPSSSTRSASSRTASNLASGSSQLSVANDNTIPPPPDMSPRPKATPWSLEASKAAEEAEKKDGDVLSLQSLRELLIPGKSTADKNLVLFNLFMTVVFITALAFLIWRLVTATRTNQLKYKHMNEMLEGEIAVIQSKLEGVKQGTSTNEELTQSFEDLKKELAGKK